MLVYSGSSIHPNIVKHIAEFQGASILPSKVLKELIGTNFVNIEGSALAHLSEFFSSRGVSSYVVEELLMKVNSYLYDDHSGYNILSDYVNFTDVRNAIIRHLNSKNNNRNKTYDVEYILSDFKSKCTEGGYYSNYNFDTNSLTPYLINAFKSFYAPSFHKLIYSVFNERGTMVSTDDGAMGMESFASIEIEKPTKNIDFHSICRDIFLASEALYSVGNEVCFDLFSYHMVCSLDELTETINGYLKTSFGSLAFAPDLSTDRRLILQSSDFRSNTIGMRNHMLKQILENVENGVNLDSLQLLFRNLVDYDLTKQHDRNFGTLFKHTGKNDAKNYSKFMTILKGAISLNSFVKYIVSNNYTLSEEDYVLFREPSYYKRFKSLEDYMLLGRVTKTLIEEGNDIKDNLPYLTNDECYDALVPRGSYNFSSLAEYLKSNANSRDDQFFNLLNEIESMKGMYKQVSLFTAKLEAICESIRINIPELEITSALCFDHIRKTLPAFDTYCEVLMFPSIPGDESRSMENERLRKGILDSKNINHVRRYMNLFLCVSLRMIELMEFSRYSNDYVILNIDKSLLFLPNAVSDVRVLSKFNSCIVDNPERISFYIAPNEFEDPNNILRNSSFAKMYYMFYEGIKDGLGGKFTYVRNWLEEIEKQIQVYSISLSAKTVPDFLKTRSVLVNGEELNSSPRLNSLITRCEVVDGFLFQNGSPLIVEGDKYVHKRGYFVSKNKNSLTPLTPIPSNYF